MEEDPLSRILLHIARGCNPPSFSKIWLSSGKMCVFWGRSRGIVHRKFISGWSKIDASHRYKLQISRNLLVEERNSDIKRPITDFPALGCVDIWDPKWIHCWITKWIHCWILSPVTRGTANRNYSKSKKNAWQTGLARGSEFIAGYFEIILSPRIHSHDVTICSLDGWMAES